MEDLSVLAVEVIMDDFTCIGCGCDNGRLYLY